MKTLYIVTELSQKSNEEKTVARVCAFSTRENAIIYIHERYLDMRLRADVGAGEKSADYSEKGGWYIVTDNDGNIVEGYLTESNIDAEMPRTDSNET